MDAQMPPHPALCQPGREHAQRERERSPPSDLRARQVRDDACDELEPGRRPARERRETRCGCGGDGVDDRGEQSQSEDHRRGNECDDVRDHRVDGRLAEVHENDRRRRKPAGNRDGECVGETGGQRVPVEPAPHARDRHEDRSNSRERELEARLEQRRRHPRHQHERSHCEEVPAIRRPRCKPGERSQPARDAGTDDRRLPANGEDVRGDDADDRELAEAPREA